MNRSLVTVTLVALAACSEVLAGAPAPAAIDLAHPDRAALERYAAAAGKEDVTFKIPAGTTIPLTLQVRGGLLTSLGPVTVPLRSQRELWARFRAGQPEFSLDGNQWGNLTSIATGTLSAGLGVSDGKPLFTVGLEAYPR
ncbi:MAG: hypothetical protein HY303_13555 [Candidatus Wallbacteria bacterium]|nr:hypothetical protein [Candidatus Wallbacteria bacterium]